MKNVDRRTVASFGEEWTRFDQKQMDRTEAKRIFDAYFRLFPWRLDELSSKTGADFGCGSGRWATIVAPSTKALYCVDASDAALAIANSNLADIPQARIMRASLAEMPHISTSSLDFGYCLGVLHHTPEPCTGLKEISRVLKPGAPLILYLYYSFDNRPKWFALAWWLSNCARLAISRLPRIPKFVATDIIAACVYWPMARFAQLLECFSVMPRHWPLAAYRSRSFYVLRNDALDRFGTPMEQRYSKAKISEMLENSGFENVVFSDAEPFWVSIAYKKLST